MIYTKLRVNDKSQKIELITSFFKNKILRLMFIKNI